MKKFSALQFLKDHFLAGLLVLTPFGVVLWLLFSILKMLWGVHYLLPEEMRQEGILLNIGIVIVLSVLIGVCISLLGWISKQYIGLKILDWIGVVIQRIPVIRSIYGSLDQLLKTFSASGSSGSQFSRVVYVQFPHAGTWTLAFVTGPAQVSFENKRHLNVFVPATPNPTSGFYLVVPEDDVRESNLRVDEAFRTILSLGIVNTSTPTRSP